MKAEDKELILYHAEHVEDQGATYLAETLRSLLSQLEEAESFIKNIHDNYDCDSDAHKYQDGFGCRCCDAERLLKKMEDL